MNKPNAPVRLFGFSRAQGSPQLHTHRVVYLQKRLWELRCSAQSDKAQRLLPDIEVRSSELFALAFYVLWLGFATMWKRATRRCRARWYRQDESDPHQSRKM